LTVSTQFDIVYLSYWNRCAFDKLHGHSGRSFLFQGELKMKVFLIALTVVIVGAGILFVVSAGPGTGNTVTLTAEPGRDSVQMFGYLPGGYVSDSANVKTTVFPDQTQCSVEFGPKTITVKGGSVDYYYLNCNHVYGHVNAKYVH
jgi:hypothetical protein